MDECMGGRVENLANILLQILETVYQVLSATTQLKKSCNFVQ
jgi:hypothetical protein